MNILLDDIPYNNSLYPFGSVQSMVHIRLGILSIFEKWQFFFPGKVFISSQQQIDPSAKNSFKKIPANIIPSLNFLKQLQKKDAEISATGDYKILQYPWQIFEYNDWAICQDFDMITEGRTSQKIPEGNQITCPENIFIEGGAKIRYSILNGEAGPVYIGKDAEIQEGSLIRGPFALCEGSRVKMGSKIYGATTIGPYCLAGGEIKNSVMTAYSNKAHDGYLGDSVIGRWCNLGAGTSNSNLKNTAGIVKVWNKEKNVFIGSGNKCGVLMGDYSRCAINTSFNTGTIIGTCCNIFGNNTPPKFIDDFTWGNEKYIFEKAIPDINNWKKLKGMEITEEEILSLKNVYSNKK